MSEEKDMTQHSDFYLKDSKRGCDILEFRQHLYWVLLQLNSLTVMFEDMWLLTNSPGRVLMVLSGGRGGQKVPKYGYGTQ